MTIKESRHGKKQHDKRLEERDGRVGKERSLLCVAQGEY